MARNITERSKAVTAASLLALALGAAAFGAVAIGALAIGRLAVGRMVIKKARFGALEVGELTVRKLRVFKNGANSPHERSARRDHGWRGKSRISLRSSGQRGLASAFAALAWRALSGDGGLKFSDRRG